MKTYLVDSDVLIDFFKKRLEAVTLIEKVAEERGMISVIAVAELRSGWSKKEALVYLPKLYNIFEVVPLTKEIAEKAGELRESYGKKGNKLPTIDALIAATAITHGYDLVTRNIKHFPMPDLSLYQDIY